MQAVWVCATSPVIRAMGSRYAEEEIAGKFTGLGNMADMYCALKLWFKLQINAVLYATCFICIRSCKL
jgi:hypothetical protein